MRTLLVAAAAALLVFAGAAVDAGAHAERQTFFPDHTKGKVPKLRTSGPNLVVCKSDSARRIRRSWRGDGRRVKRMRRIKLRMLDRCRHEHIQAAVNDAESGDRIQIMPGVYREEPSREVPDPREGPCSGEEYWEESGDDHQEDGMVPTFRHQYECPNVWSLIAIIGDSLEDDDRECDRRCNLQISGQGRRPRDVLLVGDRYKEDVIRADRADGFYLRNVAVEQGRFNNVNVVETNGFRVSRIVTRYGRNYGVLSFASDNGIHDRIRAYGNGDSGIYPGSGPEGHCARYGIDVRKINSYGNTLGFSGTAGNGTRVHNSRFHHNAAGMSTDSFAPGHPGMPQDCARWEDNLVYSNNRDAFDDELEEYCNSTPFEERRREVVCPWFQVPAGTGIMMYGANDNIVRRNRIWDNWRSGIRLFWVPAAVRGDDDPAKQSDTSNGNRYLHNVFGEAPDGRPDPNGEDVFWDEQGIGNCWAGNTGPGGVAITSDPPQLPECGSGGSTSTVSNPAKTGMEVPCATWDPEDNPDPPGCSWFTVPPEPQP